MAVSKTRRLGIWTRAILALLLTVGTLPVLAPQPAHAFPGPVQTYYVPLPEQDALAALDAINTAANEPMHTYFSISVALDGTYIYYDQWEDGYAADIANPTAAEIYRATNLDGVQVWGNGEADDGCAPNIVGTPVTCTDLHDVLNAGDVILLYNVVPLPRNQAVPLFDAGDKVAATYAIAMARAVWASGSGTLNAFAHEIYPINEWGTAYESPVGTTTATPAQGYIADQGMFTYSALTIMAAQDGTTVQIDADANGTYESTVTLDEGEATLATAIAQGASVIADGPLQVALLTGDIGSNYESRDIALLPVSAYYSSYFSPVGVNTGGSAGPTRLFLYNPSSNGSIYITCERYGVANTVLGPVAPRGVVTIDLTTGQGSRCFASTADGTETTDPIFGLGTIDTPDSSSHAGQAADWGFTLYPQTFLTAEVLVGLGLGKDPTNTTSTENGGPLWVTAACDSGGTYVYVDWENDGMPDGIDTNGDDVAETGSQNGILVNRLQSVRLFEPVADEEEYDQSGARVWSRTASGVGYGGTAGCKLAMAWGQDPNNATAGEPGLDVGTSVPPVRLIESVKTLVLLVDNDGDGLLSPGDGAVYNMSVANSGGAIVPNVYLHDTVPDNMSYVPNTTAYNMTGQDPWTPIPDDTSGTPYPLDVPGGILLGDLDTGQTYHVRFQVLLNADYQYEEVHNCDVAYTGGGNAYRCATNLVASRDWGDLPDSYSTTSAQDGPRHSPSALILGTWFDRDLEGQPAAGADGDDLAQSTLPHGDDEDGVTNAATMAEWTSGDGAFDVTVTGGSGCLNAWMDFTDDAGNYQPVSPYTVYADGNFTDSGGYDSVTYASTTYSEHIIQNALLTAGTTTVPVSVPPSLNLGDTAGFYFRFRLSPPDAGGQCTAAIAHNGPVTGGEVEDYLFHTAIAIGDTIWFDWNGDGIQDAGEPGIPGVRVFIDVNNNGVYDAGDLADVTDANGQYIFGNLAPGTYRVIVDPTTLPAGLTQTGDPDDTLDHEHTVVSATSGYYDYVDFGYRGTGSISDLVWNDLDGNGVQDAGEGGIEGVTVWVDLNGDGIQDPNEPSDMTDANGHYYIGGLPAGSYTVRTSGAAISGATPTYDLDDADTPNVTTVTLTAGENRTDVDWGYQFAVLSIAKTSNPAGALNPGDTIEYTIVVHNNTTGRHTGIAITDPLPAGTTYVAQSTVATGYILATSTADYYHTFENGISFSGSQGSINWDNPDSPWTEDDNDDSGTDWTTGNIQVVTNPACPSGNCLRFQNEDTDDYVYRRANLTVPGCSEADTITLQYDYNNQLTRSGNQLDAYIYTGSTQRRLVGSYTSSNTGTGSVLFTLATNEIANNTRIRLNRVNDPAATGDYFYIDNVRFTCTTNTVTAATRDNIPGGANPDLANGTPPSLVVAGDGFALNPGQSMQVTFQVTVNDPVALFSIDNIASVVSVQQPEPQYAPASNPIIQPASVGDRVWLDEDGDGVQDAGEAGIPNVIIELRDGTCTPGSDCPTTVTDANGNYLFTGVAPGSYTVAVIGGLPDGLNDNPTYDEDGTSTPNVSTVTVTQGEEHVTADFGYNWAPSGDVTTPGPDDTGAIGDRLWIDADGDGVQDPGEAGLAGIPVTIYYDPDGDGVYDTPYPNALDADGNPIASGTTTTDAAGNYIFDNLPAGGYVVVVNGGVAPAGYTQTGDPDQPGMTCTACDNQTTTPIVLAPGDVYVNADLGYQPSGHSSTIGDTIYLDTDGDGVQDASDPGIPGVTVALLDGNGNIIATTTTDAGGNYSFPGLPAGTYTVWVNDTANVLGELAQTGDPDGGLDGVSTVTVDGVNDNLNQDHGYAPPGHGTGDGLIGDTIFLDRDGGNDVDPGEGLEGVRVALFQDTNGDGNYDPGEPLVAVTTTDENGNYYFGNLPAGDYVVMVDPTTLPAGVTNTVDPDTTNSPQNESGVTLGAGQINLDQDFGYRDTSNPNTISGTIWQDTNADGTLNESGRLEGVTVVLRDADGNIVATTTTDSNGNYSFPNLPDGTYTVDVTDEANVLDGYWHSDGPNDGMNNNSQPDTYTVTVGPGNRNDSTGDWGYYRDPADLGDLVWLDLDGNGRQDADEPGIGGVKVELTITYPNGAGTTTLTTYTDADGHYSFGNLLLDENWDGLGTDPEPVLTITFDTPPGATASPVGIGDRQGDSNGATTGTDRIYFYQGQTDLSYDSGFVTERRDLGDLPDSTFEPPYARPYLTRFRPGPAHIVFPDGDDYIPDTAPDGTYAVWLGTYVDVELDGQPAVEADGDDSVVATDYDDEDGLILPAWWHTGTEKNIAVTLSSSAPTGIPDTVYFGLWIDWNEDEEGDLDLFHAGSGTTGSPVTIQVPVTLPDSYVYGTPVYIRVRADDNPFTAGDYQGTRLNGEVEDYYGAWSDPTSVVIGDFWSTLDSNSILLHWKTATEVNNLGFYVERAESLTGERSRLNADLILSQDPGSQTGFYYDFADTTAQPGIFYYYWLITVSTDLNTRAHGPITQRLGAGSYSVYLPMVAR